METKAFKSEMVFGGTVDKIAADLRKYSNHKLVVDKVVKISHVESRPEKSVAKFAFEGKKEDVRTVIFDVARG